MSDVGYSGELKSGTRDRGSWKGGRRTGSADIHLIFPPQWSPFQPFLSTPSLKAYLEGKGFSVRQSDWNVDFYDYFIGPERLSGAISRLQSYSRSLSDDYEPYRNQVLLSLGILSDYRDRHALAMRLKSPDCLTSIEDFHACVTAFKRLLHAFSVAEPVVEVGTSSLGTGRVLKDLTSIDSFCRNPDLNPFLPFFRRKVRELTEVPRYFGLSVIGAEQVLASLTLGMCLKEAFPGTPVLVGGSVFTRLVDMSDVVRHLFRRYFDYVVCYEGERPLEAFLASSDPKRERTGNLCFLEGEEIVRTPQMAQLAMADIPTPDFEGLELERYYSPEIVLPLLTTRGCYWDKCAFCYHGMIYGDRYRMRSPGMFRKDVDTLFDRHSVRHFALNDEAIPPKLFQKLPETLPSDRYLFTGLYKFEKYFRKEHYRSMYDIGFRSLYIGLETASERVQKHMRKDNTQDVMVSNLRDAHEAGIWNHTFNFFGFPTETRDEAMETATFLIEHSDIIHSEGTGTFSFEHNAPVSKLPDAFGATNVRVKEGSVLELYYDYDVVSGLSASEAAEMVETFGAMKTAAHAYQYSGWIPREHLLILLGRYERDALRARLEELECALHAGGQWAQNVSWFTMADGEGIERHYVVNARAGKILEMNRDAVLLLEFMPKDIPAGALVASFPAFEPVIMN